MHIEQQNDNEPLIDFSFLREISDNNPKYIYDVIEIFLDSTPPGVLKLQELVRDTNDWDAIGKQAHFLKSSVSIIKIRNAYDQLAKIEQIATTIQDKTQVSQLLDNILLTFNEALPLLEAEKEKNKPL